MSQVLLVDDDNSVLLTLAIALRRRGHSVTVAQSGPQALNLLRRHDYTFLVSDVRMPGMSGIELAHAASELDHPPRVVLTSALDLDFLDKTAELFMPKPVDVARLSAYLGEKEIHGSVKNDAHGLPSYQHRHVSFRNLPFR